jgi:hypothetical protein
LIRTSKNRGCRGVRTVKKQRYKSSKEIPFDIIVVGHNTTEYVNFKTNLMFTADFGPNSPTFYKTNRYVTCSAFSDQAQLATNDYRELFSTLEQA